MAAIWLGACLSVLALGYVQRDIHDMPVALVWLMILLSLPLGAAAATTVGFGIASLLEGLGIPYQPFRDELPFWAVAVIVGYWQWFVLLPRLLKLPLRHTKE